MYWICLTREELDDAIQALYIAGQCDLTERIGAEVYEALQDKLEFFRDHENQETATWEFTAKFTGDSNLPTGPWESFKRALSKQDKAEIQAERDRLAAKAEARRLKAEQEHEQYQALLKEQAGKE